jgi:hypothetical protein
VKTIADRLKRLAWSYFKARKSATVLQLIVVTTCRLLINPITNPNPISVTNTHENIMQHGMLNYNVIIVTWEGREIK